MSFLSRLIAPFKLALTGIGKSLGTLLQSLADNIARNGGDILVSAAVAAVAAAESKGGTGKEKLQLAQNAIVVTLTQRGIPIVWNAVNGAIEAAVAEYNRNVAGK